MSTLTAARVQPSPLALTPGQRLVEGARQFGLMIQWQTHRASQVLPLLVVVQSLLSVATVVGYGLIVGKTTHAVGLYLATGAPTISLVIVGLVMTPQAVGQARTEGSLDWLRTLPVPREVFLLADLAVYTIAAVPGMVLAVFIGAWRFDVNLAPTWWLIPAVLIVSLTAAAIGYALATTLSPAMAQLCSQVFVFLVMLFTPISFPADRLPDWAQEAHLWLPLEPMAQVIRGGLAPDDFSVPARSWVVLIAWCIICVGCAVAALRRRH